MKIYQQQLKYFQKNSQGDSGASTLKTNDPYEFKNEKPSKEKNYEALCRGDYENLSIKVNSKYTEYFFLRTEFCLHNALILFR